MPTSRRTLLKTSAAAAAAFSFDWTRAQAQAETVRIGLIYDLTGPFAAGGSVASSIGAQIAIDLVNEKGGVGGKYKVAAVAADSQSKPEVAINEAVRLIDQEKIDIINGVYASSHAVPLAAKVEQQKKILWITTAVSTAVFKDKNLHYVFRAQIHSDQYGQAFAGFIAEHAKAKLGMEPKDVKVALIHEDGPYGVGVATSNEAYSKEAGLLRILLVGLGDTDAVRAVLMDKGDLHLLRIHAELRLGVLGNERCEGLAVLIGVNLAAEYVMQVLTLENGGRDSGSDPENLLLLFHLRRQRDRMGAGIDAVDNVDLLLVDQALDLVNRGLRLALRVGVDRDDLVLAIHAALLVDEIDRDLRSDR